MKRRKQVNSEAKSPRTSFLETEAETSKKVPSSNSRRSRNVSQNLSVSWTDSTLSESAYQAVITRKRWWHVLDGSVRPSSFGTSGHSDDSMIPTDNSLQLSPPVPKRTREKRLSYGVFTRAMSSRASESPNSISAHTVPEKQQVDLHEESLGTPEVLPKKERLRRRLSKSVFERAICSSESPVSVKSSIASNPESNLKCLEESSPDLVENVKRKKYTKRISMSVFKNALIEKDEKSKNLEASSYENISDSESPVVVAHPRKKYATRNNTVEAFIAEMGHDDSLESARKRRTEEKTLSINISSDTDSPTRFESRSSKRKSSLPLETFHDSMKIAENVESPIRNLILDNTLHTDTSSEENIAEIMKTQQKKKRVIKPAIFSADEIDDERRAEDEELNNVSPKDMSIEELHGLQTRASFKKKVKYNIEAFASDMDISESPTGSQQETSDINSADKKSKKGYTSSDTNVENPVQMVTSLSTSASVASLNESSLLQAVNTSSPKSPTDKLRTRIRRSRHSRMKGFNITDDSLSGEGSDQIASTSPRSPSVEKVAGQKQRIKSPIRISAFNVPGGSESEESPDRTASTSRESAIEKMTDRKQRIKPPIRISAFNIPDDSESEKGSERIVSTSPRSPSVETVTNRKQRIKSPIRISAFNIPDDSESEKGSERIVSTSPRSPSAKKVSDRKQRIKPPIRISAFNIPDDSESEKGSEQIISTSPRSPSVETMTNRKQRIKPPIRISAFNIPDDSESEKGSERIVSTSPRSPSAKKMSDRKQRIKPTIRISAFNIPDDSEPDKGPERIVSTSPTSPKSPSAEKVSDRKQRIKPPIRMSAFNISDDSESEKGPERIASTSPKSPSVAKMTDRKQRIKPPIRINISDDSENNDIAQYSVTDVTRSSSNNLFTTFVEDRRSSLDSVELPRKKTRKKKTSFTDFEQAMASETNVSSEFSESTSENNGNLDSRTESVTATVNRYSKRASLSSHQKSLATISEDMEINQEASNANLLSEKNDRFRESLSAFKKSHIVRHSFSLDFNVHNAISLTKENINESSSEISDTSVQKSVSKISKSPVFLNSITEAEIATAPFVSNRSARTNVASLNKSELVRHSFSSVRQEKAISSLNVLENEIPVQSNQTFKLPRESFKAFIRHGPVRHSDSFEIQHNIPEDILKSRENSYLITTPTEESLLLSKTKSSSKISLDESRQIIPDFELSDSSVESIHVAANLVEKKKLKKPSLGLFKDLLDSKTSDNESSIHNVEEIANESDKDSPIEEIVPSPSQELPPIKPSASIVKDIDTALPQSVTHRAEENKLVQTTIPSPKLIETEIESDMKNQSVKLHHESLGAFIPQDSEPFSDSLDKELTEQISISKEHTDSHKNSDRLTSPILELLHISKTKSSSKISLEESRQIISDFERSDSSVELIHVAVNLAEKRKLKKPSLGLFKDLLDSKTSDNESSIHNVEEIVNESDKENPIEEIVPSPSQELPSIKPSESVVKEIDTALPHIVTHLVEESKFGCKETSSRKVSGETEVKLVASSTTEIPLAFTVSEYVQAFDIMESNASNTINNSKVFFSSDTRKESFNRAEFQKALEILNSAHVSIDTSSIKDFEKSNVLSSTTRLSSIKNNDVNVPSTPESKIESNKSMKVVSDESNKSSLMEASSNVISKTFITPCSTLSSKHMQRSYYRKRYTLLDLQLAMETVRSPDSTLNSPASLTSHNRYSIWDLKKAITVLNANTTVGGDISNISSFHLTPNRSSTLRDYRASAEQRGIPNVATYSSLSKQSSSMSPYIILDASSITKSSYTSNSETILSKETIMRERASRISALEASQFVNKASVTETNNFSDISNSLTENKKFMKTSVNASSNVFEIDKETSRKQFSDNEMENKETSRNISLQSKDNRIESTSVPHAVAELQEIDMVISHFDTSTVPFQESVNVSTPESHENDVFETDDDATYMNETLPITSVIISHDEAQNDDETATAEAGEELTMDEMSYNSSSFLEKTKETAVTPTRVTILSEESEADTAHDSGEDNVSPGVHESDDEGTTTEEETSIILESSKNVNEESEADIAHDYEMEIENYAVKQNDRQRESIEKSKESALSTVAKISSEVSEANNIIEADVHEVENEEYLMDEEVTESSCLKKIADKEIPTLSQVSRSDSGEDNVPPGVHESDDEGTTTEEETSIILKSSKNVTQVSRSDSGEDNVSPGVHESDDEGTTTEEETSIILESSKNVTLVTESSNLHDKSCTLQGNFSGIYSAASTSGQSEKSLLDGKTSPKSAAIHKSLSKIFSDMETPSSKSTTERISVKNVLSLQSLKRGPPLNYDNYKQMLDECCINDAVQKEPKKKNIPVLKMKTKVREKPILPERMLNGVEYKKPRTRKRKPWVTDRLYKRIDAQFALKNELNSAQLADQFVDWLVDNVTTVISKNSNTNNIITKIAKTLKKQGFVENDYDFCIFCYDYLPNSFNVKAFCFPREKYLEN